MNKSIFSRWILLAFTSLFTLISPRALAQPTGPGYALHYDGTTIYASVINPTAQVTNSGDFTVECWAQFDGPSGANRTVFSQGDNTITGGSSAFYVGLDNGNRMRLGRSWDPTGISYPSDTNWHHLAVVKVSSNAWFYLDGVLTGTHAGPILNPTNSFVMRFGLGAGTTFTEYWKGQIDEVRIWSVARSASELTNNMNRPLVGTEPGLRGYWRFDEGSGSTTHDIVGTSATIFSSGSPWTTSSVPFVPGVVTSNAFVIATAARVIGTVYPNGRLAGAFFEWGGTTNYGNQTPSFSTLTNLTFDFPSAPVFITNLTPATSYHYRLSASNSVGLNFGADRTFTTLGTNAGLFSLTCNADTLAPAFNSATTYYTLQNPVANSVTNVTVTAIPVDAGATMQVRINGGTYQAIVSAIPSSPLLLNLGDNPIDVRVAASDGLTTNTYTLTVNRAPPAAPTVITQDAGLITATSATLAALANPNGTATTEYCDWGLTTNYGNATSLALLGNGTNPIGVGFPISGLVPATTYHFRGAATNAGGLSLGAEQTFVTLSTNALLISLTSSGGALTPLFDPQHFSYGLTVAPGSIVMLTPTAADPNATLQMHVNGAGWSPIVSGAASAPLVLSSNLNEADILVTAQDGLTTRTYTNKIGLGHPLIQGVWENSFDSGNESVTRPFSDVAFSPDGESGSQVFAGKGSVVYAFDNTTGARNWTFTAGDTINRPIATRLHSGTEAVFVTSQDGLLNAINARNGLFLWPAKDTKRKSGTGTTLCGADGIVAPPAIQRYDDSDAAFRAAIGDDLVIVCTAYDASCNSGYLYNRIYGFRATAGVIAWTFNLFGQQVDFIDGCTIDSANNILYAASNQPTGRAQPTLWQISTLDGTLIAAQNYGAIRSKPILAGDRLYVADFGGTLHAVSTNLLTEIWNKQLTSTAYVSLDLAVFRPCGSDQNIVLVLDSGGHLHGVRDMGTNGVTAWPAVFLGEGLTVPVVSAALEKAYAVEIAGSNNQVDRIDLETGSIEARLELFDDLVDGLILDSSGPSSDLRVDRLTLTASPTLNGPGIERMVIPWPVAPLFGGSSFSFDKLRITNSVSPRVAIAGQPITYTLLVTNLDDTAFITDVGVTDILPIGVTNAMTAASQGTVGIFPTGSCADFVSYLADSGVGDVPTSGNQVRVGVGVLTNRTSATVTITATPNQVGFLTNTAYVLSDQTFSSSTNCNSTAVVQVLDPAADDDGDGMSNLAEYLAGTDPLNTNSCFRITSVQRVTNDISVTWTTVGGKKYELQTATNLGNGSDFVPVSPVLTAPGSGDSTTNYVEIGTGTNSARYYRVRIVP